MKPGNEPRQKKERDKRKSVAKAFIEGIIFAVGILTSPILTTLVAPRFSTFNFYYIGPVAGVGGFLLGYFVFDSRAKGNPKWLLLSTIIALAASFIYFPLYVFIDTPGFIIQCIETLAYVVATFFFLILLGGLARAGGAGILKRLF